MSSTCAIYTLADPRTGDVRYVGQTKHFPIQRLAQHIDGARIDKNDRKADWINSLAMLGLMPIVEIIEFVLERLVLQREQYWITEYKFKGCDLLNSDIAVDRFTSPHRKPRTTNSIRRPVGSSYSELVYDWLDEMNKTFHWRNRDEVPSARSIAKLMNRSIPPSSAQRGRNRWIKQRMQ